jgi:hypothetical protein
VAAFLVSLALAPAGAAQVQVNRQGAAMADFAKRIEAYTSLHKKLTAGLPPLQRTDDPAEIASREAALGAAIRAGRAGARRGDILTPDVARFARRVIKDNFRRRTLQGQKTMRDEIPHFRPTVNQTYSSTWPLATVPAALLAELPKLPAGLEYRLLSDALVLHDIEANIIVDFILDVF